MKTYLLDGVYVSELGFNQIRNLSQRMTEKRKPRKPRLRGGIVTPGTISRILSTESMKSEEDLDGDSAMADPSGGLCFVILSDYTFQLQVMFEIISSENLFSVIAIQRKA